MIYDKKLYLFLALGKATVNTFSLIPGEGGNHNA